MSHEKAIWKGNVAPLGDFLNLRLFTTYDQVGWSSKYRLSTSLYVCRHAPLAVNIWQQLLFSDSTKYPPGN